MKIDTKKLAAFVIALVVFVYLRFYLTVSKDIKIMQLSVLELTPSILMKKQPIVLDERIVNPMSLLQTVFKYMYVYKRLKAVEDDTQSKYTQNKARFLVLFSNNGTNSIEIANPCFKQRDSVEPPFIEIMLHANMCMIVPHKWLYRVNTPRGVSSIALDDVLSLVMSAF